MKAEQPKAPRHLQEHLTIADYLVRKMTGGELLPKQRIPSLNELAKHFKVNRNVAISALKRLESQGWITPLHGKGYFVKERPQLLTTSLSKFDRYTTNMLLRGQKPNAHLLDWSKDQPTSEEKHFLALAEGVAVYRLEILRFVGSTPLGVATSILPVTIVPNLERHLDSFRSLHGLLNKHYGFVPFKKKSIIETRMPSVQEAELLELPEHVPIMCKVNVLINAKGIPVELDFFRIRGDLIQYVVDYDRVGEEWQQGQHMENDDE